MGRPNKRNASQARTKVLRDEGIGRAVEKLALEENFQSSQEAARELQRRFLENGGGAVSDLSPKLLEWVEGKVSTLSESIAKTRRNNQSKRSRPDSASQYDRDIRD